MGNCLFDSLNVFIGLPSSHALRLALCEYVALNASTFEADIVANDYGTVQRYVDYMSRNGVNGDHLMIAAAALRFNMIINVQMPNRRVFTEQPTHTDSSTRTCAIDWVPGHYSVSKYPQNGAKPREGAENSTKPIEKEALALSPAPPSSSLPPRPPLPPHQQRIVQLGFRGSGITASAGAAGGTNRLGEVVPPSNRRHCNCRRCLVHRHMQQHRR